MVATRAEFCSQKADQYRPAQYEEPLNTQSNNLACDVNHSSIKLPNQQPNSLVKANERLKNIETTLVRKDEPDMRSSTISTQRCVVMAYQHFRPTCRSRKGTHLIYIAVVS